MMCAAYAGKGVLVFDHAKKPGEKIRISGGGRCNFTNLLTNPSNFISQNPHFMKSALRGFTQQDFIKLIENHAIAYHEKTLGQLFCDESSQNIISLLLKEMGKNQAELSLQTCLIDITKRDQLFQLTLEKEGKRHTIQCQNFVIASGGKSIPKMGATGLGYQLAQQFGHKIIETRPGLVPLTFDNNFLTLTKTLSGVSLQADIRFEKMTFREGLLFTHRGLSGPAILQISSYWQEGKPIYLSLLQNKILLKDLKEARRNTGKRSLKNHFSDQLPKNLVSALLQHHNLTGNLGDQPDKALDKIAKLFTNWSLHPVGTEGYRTAEVTLGGVDTKDLYSKTMMSRKVENLYFIGEVVDVTGWLGGYNFQWAWSSGVAAGKNINQ